MRASSERMVLQSQDILENKIGQLDSRFDLSFVLSVSQNWGPSQNPCLIIVVRFLFETFQGHVSFCLTRG